MTNFLQKLTLLVFMLGVGVLVYVISVPLWTGNAPFEGEDGGRSSAVSPQARRLLGADLNPDAEVEEPEERDGNQLVYVPAQKAERYRERNAVDYVAPGERLGWGEREQRQTLDFSQSNETSGVNLLERESEVERSDEEVDPFVRQEVQLAERDYSRLSSAEDAGVEEDYVFAEEAEVSSEASPDVEVTGPRLLEIEQYYLDRAWRKYASEDSRFTFWMPSQSFYARGSGTSRSDLYQSQFNNIFYGLEYRRTGRAYNSLSDPLLRRELQASYESWRAEYAGDVPGLVEVSERYDFDDAEDGRHLDVLMGADSGQIRLRVLIFDNAIVWMWTVYRHQDKSKVLHDDFVNSVRIVNRD